MGTGISTSKWDDNSPLLKLCRERKEFIRAAADCRYQLAAAHVLYLQSLLDVGNALNQFVEEELLVLSDCSSSDSSEDDHSEAEIVSDHVHDHSDVPPRGSPNLQTSSSGVAATSVSPSDVGNNNNNNQSNNQVHSQPDSRSKVIDGAAAVDDATLNGNVSHPQRGNRVAYWSPLSFNQSESGVEVDDSAAAPSASPIFSSSTDWDSLNPFKVIDDVNSSYYSQKYYFSEFNSDQDYQELRKREGIPDLEDETRPIPVQVSKGESAGTKSETSGTGASPNNLALIIPVNEHTSKDGRHIQAKDTVSEDGESVASSLTSLDDCVLKNINEIVKEIRDTFETIFNNGKEVAVILEAGKLPYQPMSAKLKDVVSRIFGFPSLQSNQLAPRTMMGKAISGDFEDMSRKFGDLSFTLEQLSAWEKKLCNEVLVEEKLRVVYDKMYKQQKILDDKGAEYSKIDDVHSSLTRSISRLNVVITAVEVISIQVHRLRDEDLLAQLVELIQGLMRMWDFMVKCHRKQFRTIIGTKAYVHMANADSRKSSKMKATQRLEKKILNWGRSFRDYVNTQKAFVKFLNEWHLRCIFHEPEATPEGIPTFSPSSIGAPPCFTICGDWCHGIEKISDSGVYEAIYSFASSLHQLWKKQNEEKHERQKTKQLSKEFEKQLSIFQEESGLNWQRDALLSHLAASEFHAKSEEADAGSSDNDLVYMNKRLEERKAKHEQIVRQLNDAASNCLHDGLVPIFEALEKFCLENLQAYNQIRLPNRQQDRKDNMRRKHLLGDKPIQPNP